MRGLNQASKSYDLSDLIKWNFRRGDPITVRMSGNLIGTGTYDEVEDDVLIWVEVIAATATTPATAVYHYTAIGDDLDVSKS